MVYFCWETISLILSNAKVNKRKAALFLITLLWIIMSIRSLDMGISDTRGVYLFTFGWFKSLSLSDAISLKSIFDEPVMTIIIWLSSRVLVDFRIFVIFTSLIPLISVYYFINKNTYKIIDGVLIYFSLFYFYQSFLIKQMLALAVVLFAFDSLKKRNLIKYLAIICIAGFIHKSAFILIPVYFLCKYVKFNKYFFIFIFAGVLFGIFYGEHILNILYKMSFYNFESYIKNGIYGTNGRINLSMFIYIFLTFFCYAFKKNKNDSGEFNDYLILMFIGCVLNSWSTVVVEFYRIALYFMCPVCILLPEALENVPKKYKNAVKFLLISFLLLYSFKIAFNCNCLPYHTFLYD